MMQAMAYPHPPPETWDQILDYLWDDTSALKACSMSCRSWLPRTRYHLFYTMSVYTVQDCDRVRSFLDASPEHWRFVRQLRVESFCNVPILMLNPRRANAALCTILPRLQNVEHLVLGLLDWEADLSSETRHALMSFPLLRTLRCEGTIFRNYDAVFDILSAMPRGLRSFHCIAPPSWYNMWTPAANMDRAKPLPLCPSFDRLGSLALHTILPGVVSRVVPWLEHKLCPWELEVTCSGPEDREALARLLDSVDVAQCIEDLKINDIVHWVQSRIPFDPTRKPFTFANLTRLRSLTLVIRPGHIQHPWLSWVLAEIPSHVLQRLTLTLTPSLALGDRYTYFGVLDCANVDDALARLSENSPNLSVVFDIAVLSGDLSRHDAEVSAAVVSSFPKLMNGRSRVGVTFSHFDTCPGGPVRLLSKRWL